MASEPRSTTAPAASGCGRALTTLLPFTATLTSLLIGVGIGAVAGWVVKPVPKQISYQRTTSLTEIVEVCEPLVTELQTQLTGVVADLELVSAQVALREAEIPELEPLALAQGAAPSAADGRNYVAERAAAIAQRDEFGHQQQMLERIRDGLVDQLTRTRERLLVADRDLAEQVAISDLLRDEKGRLVDPGLLSAWFDVVRDTENQICGTGTGRRSEDCRAAVARELADRKEEFVRCMRAGQPVPTAHGIEKEEALPPFARALDPGNDLVSGWYLTSCDPALPEAVPTTE